MTNPSALSYLWCGSTSCLISVKSTGLDFFIGSITLIFTISLTRLITSASASFSLKFSDWSDFNYSTEPAFTIFTNSFSETPYLIKLPFLTLFVKLIPFLVSTKDDLDCFWPLNCSCRPSIWVFARLRAISIWLCFYSIFFCFSICILLSSSLALCLTLLTVSSVSLALNSA